MKKLIAALILTSTLLLILVGCNGKYKPVESSEEEARVMMTLGAHEVRYELYRALFLTYKSEIDKGDNSVWSGESKDDYIKKINERIVKEAALIFAVFELCQRCEIDLYSRKVEKEIREMIKISVEGGSFGDAYYEGFGKDYSAYLESLREMYHNYSTAVLLMRYEIGRRELEKYYIGDRLTLPENGKLTDGKLDYTTGDVRDFYFSDASAQILATYIPENISYTPREMAESIRRDVIEEAKSGDEAVKILMINRGTPTATAELERGIIVGKYSLNRDYRAIADAAIELKEGEVSEVIETVSAADGRRFYVVYRAEKSEEFFNNCYSEVVTVYLYDAIGGAVESIANLLRDSVSYTSDYATLTHADIRM